MNAEQMKDQLQSFKAEFSKITRAKHPLEIKHFIVGSHISRWRQWYQLCIECDSKWLAVQDAEGKQRIMELEIEELEIKIAALKTIVGASRREEILVEKLEIELQSKRNHFERSKGYMVGALKEIADYLHLAQTEYKEFWGRSEDEWVQDGEREYWVSRLSSQIAVDMSTFGRIQAGNLAVLLQAPEDIRTDILREALKQHRSYAKYASQIENEFAHPELEGPSVKRIG
jgi:hypothetical protein